MFIQPETHLRHHNLRNRELQRAAAMQKLVRELNEHRRTSRPVSPE